tara:strand:- start:92 stop:283 length:192 start_codon:yes stop_codon:yes gene_type:complete
VIDYPTTQANLSIVKHDGLSGSNGPLSLIKQDLIAIVILRDSTPLISLSVTNFGFASEFIVSG